MRTLCPRKRLDLEIGNGLGSIEFMTAEKEKKENGLHVALTVKTYVTVTFLSN